MLDIHKMKTQLSCIIITLNEEKHLPLLLESLKKQTFKDFETIVADYNSIDKTAKIAKSFGCRITKGGTYSVGRNNGAKIAKADYFLFLDADCILPPDFLEKNFNAFKKSKKGTGTCTLIPLSDKKVDKAFYKLYDYWSKMMSKISPHCAGCGIFSRKDVFNKVGGFDEKIIFAENHDFVKRAKKYGFTILPEPMFTSVRRLDEEGRSKFLLKYIYSGLYRLFYKEIDKKLFEYG